MDLEERTMVMTEEVKGNWDEHYPRAREELPKDLPTPKGKKIIHSTYVDADHARDNLNRRSVTGILVFLNNWILSHLRQIRTYG